MTAADPIFDAEAILAVLISHRVDFVVVGGIAVQAHGYIRGTRDLDIVAQGKTLNFTRLSEALADLEAEPRAGGALRLTDPHVLRAMPLIPLHTRSGPLDVVNLEQLRGAPADYEALRRKALRIKLRDMEVAVAGLSDLIRMKRAAGRPQDLADIEALTRQAEST